MKRQPSEINREWYSAAEVGQIFGFTADTVLKGRAGFDALPRHFKPSARQKEACSVWSPAVEVFAHHSTPARSPLSGRFGALPGASPTVRWGYASPLFHTLPHQAKL